MLSRLRQLLRREHGESRQTEERQKEADLQNSNKTRSRRCFGRRHRTAGEPVTPKIIISRKQQRKEIEKLTKDLKLATKQRDELRDRLLFISEGTEDNRPDDEPSPSFEKAKSTLKQVIADLKISENENTETSENHSELSKMTDFYRGLGRQLLVENRQLCKKVNILRQEKKKHLEEWNLLKYHLMGFNVVSKDKEGETDDLKTQQPQVQKYSA